MSLYGKDDSAANVTKAGRGVAASSQSKTIVFVDNTEAALAENKARGINAPGWWSYYTFTDCDGNTRHKAEMLVTIADPEANSQESQGDDAIAADRTVIITSQPSDLSVSAGDAAQFTVAVTIEPNGSPVYQWQESTDGGSNWSDLATAGVYSGHNNTTLSISDATGLDGYKYRCRLRAGQAGTSADKFTNEVTLTVA